VAFGLHLLDDVPPADAGVVGAEADLPHLRAVRDDAHLGAAEVVVVEILEPHPATKSARHSNSPASLSNSPTRPAVAGLAEELLDHQIVEAVKPGAPSSGEVLEERERQSRRA
jgi:hypothetical protein